ncbi:alpha/beta hydrolase fold protein-like protein [Rhizodiscina lignyota]|uniref:Alpha/beta hydrolase fold protein-like protein n=1 Tax=Rhizodiscina lignyota TaxID=1504668 RepID=A0A9P4IK66_9PEZI|nr:alpha/beta hydrolase fold protein-like protein [Rhizodiscina lignyota]
MAARAYDDTAWRRGHAHISGQVSTPDEVTLAYIDCVKTTHPKGNIVLIHGFPQTSYQFRHVITPLADAGYRVIAPDYRGAGDSSHPRGLDGFHKTSMAADIYALLTTHLDIAEPAHIVGHDIGAMVSHALATSFPSFTQSVIFGECPLPGTSTYSAIKHDPAVFHFSFHQQPDLPEALVAGREAMYLEHFYARHAHNAGAIGDGDIAHYVRKYSQAGALRCGFDTYRAFEADARANVERVKAQGKCSVPCLALAGRESPWCESAEGQAREMYSRVEAASVEGSGHWCAEENPEGFVEAVLRFVEKYNDHD